MEPKFGDLDLPGHLEATLPSGSEVEAARIHVPATSVTAASSYIPPGAGWPASHDPQSFKSRVVNTLNDAAFRSVKAMNRIRERSAVTATSLRTQLNHHAARTRTAMAQVGPTLRDGADLMQTEMRANPQKWAGIAAGAGMVLGLTGRYLRHRAKHAKHVRKPAKPSIVIIEAAC